MTKSVLIFSHGELIGDGMMKLPFINALNTAFPDAEITWLSGRHSTIFASALAPLVHGKIHNIINHTKLGDSIGDAVFRRWKSVLPQRSYDIIINTDQHLLPTLMLKTIPHKMFISASMKWLLSDQKPPLTAEQAHYEKPILLLNRLMDLLCAATQKTIAPIFGITIPQSMLELAQSLLPKGRNVLLAPGAGGRFKCWPLQNFIDLGNRLIADGINVGYILGPAEKEWQPQLALGVKTAFFPLAETTEKSVFVTIAFARLADLSIANDGGVGHILASADQPLISMWGPTDPYKSTPNGAQVHVIYARDYGTPSMDTLTVDMIYEHAKKILTTKTKDLTC
ncbi:MAG: glycosyltransferase family 9 protein [Pseudomonadota bacterium]